MKSKSLFVLILFATLCLQYSVGQVAVGAPPYATIAGGTFDSVNLANLNVHFEVPVFSKPGRGGIPFQFSPYHSYYRLTGNDGVTHQFEVLGDPGSSHNQQVRDTYGTDRQSVGQEHIVFATEAQAAALINRSEYFENNPCPVCTGGQEGYNLVFHNSNSFVYNMLNSAPAGGIPVPAAPFNTPGYAQRPDDWY